MTIQPVTPAQGGPASVAEPAAPGRATTADLMEYMRSHNVGPGSMDNLDLPSRARALGNPAAFGENVLANMEGFYDRLSRLGQVAEPARAAGPAASDPVMPGPAARHPGSAADGFESMLDTFRRVNVSAIETTLVVSGGSRLSNTVNTVMRGQ